MPRSPAYRDYSVEDWKAALTYVSERTKKLVDTKLVRPSDQPYLINEATAVKYGVMVGEVQQDGCLIIPFQGEQILHNPAGLTWIIILEAKTSEAIMVPLQHLIAAVNDPANVSVIVSAVNQGIKYTRINFAWLKVRLAKKAAVLGKDPSPMSRDCTFMAFRRRTMGTSEEFCHLHVHSMYSFLDGVSTPEGIVQRAIENGQPGIALTDHGYGFALFKFYKAAREAKIHPVLGIEFYVCDDIRQKYKDGAGNDRRFEYHLTVLAMNNVGWQNLCRLASLACEVGYYYVPRIDWRMLQEHNEGLIVLSGCFKGAVAWHLQPFEKRADTATETLATHGPIYRRDPDRSRLILRWLKQVFGDRLYGELQNIDFDRYMACVPELAQLCREEGVPTAVTNDCHFEVAEDKALQMVLSRISAGVVGDGLGTDFGQKGVYYIKARHEMEGHPAMTPDAFSRTCEIMSRCKVHIPIPGDEDFKYQFPRFDIQADRDWPAFIKSRQAGVTK